MKSRPYLLYPVLGAAMVALWFNWYSAQGPAPGRSTAPAVGQAAPGTNQPSPTGAGVLSSLPGAPSPAGVVPTAGGLATGQVGNAPSGILNPIGPAPAPNQAALIDVGRVRHLIGDYHTLMGENPVGTNAEIMKQLMGGNAHQANLGPPDGLSLNAQGELVDQWGTPYFFHQLSRDRMEVRSAGPDKVMWTADDLVAR